jgi:hypothetical protein
MLDELIEIEGEDNYTHIHYNGTSQSNRYLGDVQKLCCFFSNDIYYIRKENEESDSDIGETFTVTDKKTNSQRTYSIRRFIYHPLKKSELCCLYTAHYTDGYSTYKYAFLVWRGTYSWEQVNLDFHAATENQDLWREQLIDICHLFLTSKHLKGKHLLSNFLKHEGIEASEYDWYVTGHSLGGALATMTGDLLLLTPSLINLDDSSAHRIKKVITFASMKLPSPVHKNDNDYANKNNIIEFFSSWDELPEGFCPKDSIHLGKVEDGTRINVGYFRWKNFFTLSLNNFPLMIPIPHSVENFLNYFEDN